MSTSLTKMIQQYAVPFDAELPLQQIVDAIDESQIVLLGESTHGTSEYYTARARLSKKLIEEKGFSVIVAENEWPSSMALNRYIKGYPSTASTANELLQTFKRWPTWMWANKEVSQFIEWLKKYNNQLQTSSKIGFYGFDLYSLTESIQEVAQKLKEFRNEEQDFFSAQQVSSCFESFEPLPDHYAMATFHYARNCAMEATDLLSAIQKFEHLYPIAYEERLNIKMNALVIKNAEHYYRTSLKSDTLSWNIRDEHMAETIHELKNYFGINTKLIVWAHNTHIGDASATAMKDEDMINVGQLLREQFGPENIYAVGFGTYHGKVIAGDKWGAPFQKMEIPPAKQHSWESYLHTASAQNQVLLFNESNRHFFNETLDHRAIGVVYQPEYEAYGNYVPSKISERYDAFIYFDQTTALKPLQS